MGSKVTPANSAEGGVFLEFISKFLQALKKMLSHTKGAMNRTCSVGQEGVSNFGKVVVT